MSESTIQKEIKDFLNQIGKCTVIHGDEFMEVGTPDILGCVEGRFLALEVKEEGKKNTVTMMQKHRMNEYKNAGAIVGVVSCIDEVKNLLEKYSIFTV